MKFNRLGDWFSQLWSVLLGFQHSSYDQIVDWNLGSANWSHMLQLFPSECLTRGYTRLWVVSAIKTPHCIVILLCSIATKMPKENPRARTRFEGFNYIKLIGNLSSSLGSHFISWEEQQILVFLEKSLFWVILVSLWKSIMNLSFSLGEILLVSQSFIYWPWIVEAYLIASCKRD